MGKTYRIKATPGKDQNLLVQVDQDFEQLEILSLKIRQDDVYLRMCSDYGVIAGRVFANNGYGIPNAKVSVFIPLLPEDENNPIISSIYPFKSLEETNEDGYKFNLLPYIPSYAGHVPTGTFPTRKDALVNQTVIELYEKYYKYTVTTNDSGDYMIYGVPVGTQTLVMNVDLSDIGPFSLAPADLIRMGVATEEQFDGNRFKSSSNFNELPQIIAINKIIEVSPFWGQPDICQIGITRTDFDLTSESNIDIQPTAIFMGSLMSSNEKTAISSNGVAAKSTGDLCKMITGPGEIIAISQTIFRDSNGLPILERTKLPNGGKLIDGSGTWLFDLPMNMDYVYTNEFGEQVLSDDPSVGVPTKAKYRFKVKWQQSSTVTQDYKRGYFLIPNIREKGWDDSTTPPVSPSTNNPDFQSSYAFSLDWSAYTSSPVINITNPDIAEAINCVDRFYEFDYNKVYTTAQLIDNYKTSTSRERFIGIKRIDDDTCSDSVNRYPVNDGVFHTTIIWIIFNILIALLSLIFTFIILPIYHILAFIWNTWLIDALLFFLVLMLGNEAIQNGVSAGLSYAASDVGAGIAFTIAAVFYALLAILILVYWEDISSWEFPKIRLPMMTYPDCDSCDCDGNTSGSASGGATASPSSSASSLKTVLTDFTSGSIYLNKLTPFLTNLGDSCFPGTIDESTRLIEQLSGFSGATVNDENKYVPKNTKYTISGTEYVYSTDNIPFGERINLFNAKTKYHEGFNQISVEWEPSNPGNTPHLDNVLVFICTSSLGTLTAGTMVTFVNPAKSTDPNITGNTVNSLGTNNTTGTTMYPTSITVNYANPSTFTSNLIKNYTFTSTYTDQKLYEYPSDVEYFQILTGMTISDFRNISSTYSSDPNFSKTFAGILESDTTITKTDVNPGTTPVCSVTLKNIDLIDQTNNYVIMLQRGVDPYSPRYSTQIGLGKIFGSSNISDVLINENYRLNIPILNTTAGTNQELMFKHNGSTNNSTPNNGFQLFFPSYIFTPLSSGPQSYLSYNTNKHSYYSELDSTLSYNIVNPASSFVSYVNNSNTVGVKNLRSTTSNIFYEFSLTNNTATYQAPVGNAFESVVGTSYMWGPNIPSNSIAGAGGYYYSKIYDTGATTMTMSNSNRIVMRSDRLPSSDSSGSTKYGNNTLLLQQNTGTTIYAIGANLTTTLSGSLGTPQYGTDPIPQPNAFNQVLDTFDCSGMTLLKCYQSNGLTFNVSNTPECKPPTKQDVINGCYILVRDPLFGVISDIELSSEFFYRFRFNYALCQGVLSNVFNNNWINGNLYAVPFKIDTFYNSQNQVSSQDYPRGMVMFHNETNNFYYRSSPWGSSGNFCGSPNGIGGSNGINNYNLKTPTTITNLGPRELFLKEIAYSGDFDGYNMSGLTETSYKDLGEMINFFSIIRLVDSNFWKNIFSDQIRRLFSRGGNRVDADFAQSAAINSQIGVIPFDGNFYSTQPASPGDIPSVIAANFTGTIPAAGPTLPAIPSSNLTMMGIFFSSTTQDLQTRDFISPGRVNRYNTIINQYTFDYLPIKSQIVPHYRWNVLNTGATIFGQQTNEWSTNQVDILQNVRYQKLDRLTHYPYGVTFDNSVPISNLSENMRGYIFGKDSLGKYQVPPPLVNSTLYNNSGLGGALGTLGGAPWYFYFGLRRGQTAINRFYTKYVGEGGLDG